MGQRRLIQKGRRPVSRGEQDSSAQIHEALTERKHPGLLEPIEDEGELNTVVVGPFTGDGSILVTGQGWSLKAVPIYAKSTPAPVSPGRKKKPPKKVSGDVPFSKWDGKWELQRKKRRLDILPEAHPPMPGFKQRKALGARLERIKLGRPADSDLKYRQDLKSKQIGEARKEQRRQDKSMFNILCGLSGGEDSPLHALFSHQSYPQGYGDSPPESVLDKPSEFRNVFQKSRRYAKLELQARTLHKIRKKHPKENREELENLEREMASIRTSFLSSPVGQVMLEYHKRKADEKLSEIYRKKRNLGPKDFFSTIQLPENSTPFSKVELEELHYGKGTGRRRINQNNLILDALGLAMREHIDRRRGFYEERDKSPVIRESWENQFAN
ncbi:MAG: hypothetical protein ABIH92_03695 [Nanoarchaeota archaeon]